MGRILRAEQFCKWVTEPSLEHASRSIIYQSYGLKENMQLGLNGMRNLELYGVEKVAQELRSRELHILSIASNGEKAARTMAWKMFCEDELWVINKSVTKKGVQLVFYVFVALGLFGLYKIFF